MTNLPYLTLPEELCLLALHDRTGQLLGGVPMHMILGAGYLAQLLVDGVVDLELGGKEPLVKRVQGDRPEHPIVAECLKLLDSLGKTHSASHWVSVFSASQQLHDLVAQELCRQGILRVEKQKVLIFFNRTTYPTRDPRPERAITDRMDRALQGREELDERTALLISIVNRGGLLPHLYTKRDLERYARRLEEIERGEACGDALKAAIEAANSAFVVGLIASQAATQVAINLS